jgi:hypothetical protein
MFPKSFLIAYDLMKNQLSRTEPVAREDLIQYVYKNFDCTEMFFNKIQSQLKRAHLINVPMEKDSNGVSRRSKVLVKLRDVSVIELYELLIGPYPQGELESSLRPILKNLDTKK